MNRKRLLLLWMQCVQDSFVNVGGQGFAAVR